MVRCTNMLSTVNANWNDDGWNVETYSVSNPNSWNAGNEFVSRYPFLSPHNFFIERSFLQANLYAIRRPFGPSPRPAIRVLRNVYLI